MEQALASSPCRAKAVSLSKVIEARRRGSSRRKPAISTATVSAADLPASRAASTNRVLRSFRTSTGRVRLQISRSPSQCPASFRSWTSSGRSWIERAPLGDGAPRLTSPAAAAPGAPARQQLPELLGLLPGPVDEGVDGLGRDGAQPALLAPLQPAGDLLGRPPFQEAFTHEPAGLGVAFEDGRPLPPRQVAALGMDGQGVAAQLAADRRGRPAERPRDRP